MGREYAEIAAGTRRVPLYLVQFDKNGACTSPLARAAVIEAAQSRDYPDVYVFAHGWNNGFDASLELFTNFFQRFLELRPIDPLWKPLFVGIQWPSIALVFPWERGPKIADDTDIDFQRRATEELLAHLPDTERVRFKTLTARDALSESERNELLQFTASALASTSSSEIGEDRPAAADLLQAWRALQASATTQNVGEFGFAEESDAAPLSAGLEVLDPRNLIRVATVYTMKDRAGIIGSTALGPLIEQLASTGAQVRLIGHSFGARIVLAALATASLDQPVRSALLLQPAVNQYCLAEAGLVPTSVNAGGFRDALTHLRLPIYSTFSAKDFPLHDTFHLSLRRAKDLREAAIAGGAPSIYCALGGYGPRGLRAHTVMTTEIQDSDRYSFTPGTRLLALDGSRDRINGHGDITNRYACWALVDQDQQQLN